VLLDLLTGGVFEMNDNQSIGGKTRFSNLPLADYPLLITERREVDLSST